MVFRCLPLRLSRDFLLLYEAWSKKMVHWWDTNPTSWWNAGIVWVISQVSPSFFWGNHWFWATQIAFRNWLKPKASAHRYSKGPKRLWGSNAYSPTHALQQYTIYIYYNKYVCIYVYIYMINWGLGFFFFESFQTNAWFSRVCSTSVPWLSRSTGKLWCIFHCYVWVLEGSQCVYEVRWNWSTWHASYSWRSPMGLFFDEWLAIHSWFVTVDWLLLMVKLPS